MGQADRYLEGAREKSALLYAYIEKENIPSMQLSKRMGYVTIRQMDLTFFSRFSPWNFMARYGKPVAKDGSFVITKRIIWENGQAATCRCGDAFSDHVTGRNPLIL